MKNLTLTIIITLAAFAGVFGQGSSNTTSLTKYSTPPSVALDPVSGNPKIGDFGSISEFNGRLNYVMPLHSVGGRGGADYTISIDINRLWQFDYHYGVYYPYWPDPSPVYTRSTSPNSTPWWGTSLKYMPGRLIDRVKYGPQPICNNNLTNYTYEGSLTFISQDGSEITLFPETLPQGLNIQCTSYSSNPDSPGSHVQVALGNVFKTFDGSAIKFVSDQLAIVGGGLPNSGLLYFPNGKKYRIDDSFVSWIEDRHGNRTTFSYDIHPNTQQRYRINQIVDSNGRPTNISYDQYNSEVGTYDRISYSGLNGQTQEVLITFSPLESALRAGETLKNQTQLFGELECQSGTTNCPPSDLINPTVINSVVFPGNKIFRYKYNSYAELARVETPRGVAFEYDWGASLDGGSPNGRIDTLSPFPDLFRQLREKRVYENGGSGSSFTFRTVIGGSTPSVQNTYPNVYSTRTITSYGQSNTLAGVRTTTFWGHPLQAAPKPDEEQFNEIGTMFPTWWIGKDKETKQYASDGVTLVSRSLKKWSGEYESGLIANPRVAKVISIAIEGNNALASLSETEYDGTGSLDYFVNLNAKRSKAYGYKALNLNNATTASFDSIFAFYSTADLIAVSENEYHYDQAYRDRNIVGLVSESRVLNPQNTNEVLAKSQVIYDEPAYQDFGYTTTNWVDPGTSIRGNATTQKTWVVETNSWVESHTMYDNFGNVRKVWDTSNDPTRFVEAEYSPTYKYAYATKARSPAPDPTGIHGMAETSEVTKVFDFDTGLLLSVTDANGQTATTEYDSLMRPIRVNPPSGGSISEMVYNDTPGDLWVKSRSQIDEANWAESTSYFDNLGRPLRSRTKDEQGDVATEVRYDSLGRLKAKSNPYRLDTNGNAIEAIYWSKPRYDSLGRTVETYAPALIDPNSSAQGPSMGTVQFGISTEPGLIGSYTIGTDASGRKSRAISGIYGLMRVDEATGIGGTVDQDLGSLSNPNQPTSYSYNVKGELIKITQGKTGQPIQHRYFAYDSLGRLIRIRQPEQTPNAALATTGNPDNNQWTAGYAYDVFGNVISMTDAKNTTITTEYDKAGRTVKRTYSDGTPQAEFFYDGKGLPSVPAFSRGALTKATNGISEDRFTEFDNHGRLKTSQQLIDGQSYEFLYRYNLSGGLIEQVYPSGRIVRNYLDQDGGLNVVTSKASNGQNKVVASNFDYTAAGGIKKMKLGNGLWETSQVNERFQLTQVGLGTTATNNNLFKIDYEYGEISSDHTSVDLTKNVGMIARTTTTIPTMSFVQTYKYDAIARLTEAKEKTGTTTNWQQTFGYDIFGNRTSLSQSINGSSIPNTNINHPTIDPTNNRFTTGQGYTFDSNGNLIQDAEGRSFTFDGNDKQTVVRDLNIPTTQQNPDANVIGRYYYDASGARVKKVTNTETTVFIYDAAGALAAEYSTQVETANPQENYLTTDHLGSPRVITDKTGNVVARRDFMPFGEELGAGIGTRTATLNYAATGTDAVRKRFTGYEKDQETQLDFAEARMYQNKHGRFTAVDPLMASARPIDPQTFNRYTYTGNNPINRTDPSGLNWCKNAETGDIRYAGRGVACNSKENVHNDQVGEIKNCGNQGYCEENGVSEGVTVRYLENGKLKIELSAAQQQDAIATAVQVQDTASEIIESTASIIVDFGFGTLQGAAGAACMGQCPAMNPSSGDTIPQRLGQVLGDIVIGAIGGTTLVEGVAGDGAALATGQVEALPVTLAATAIGGYLVIGSTVYASEILEAGVPDHWLKPENIERMKQGRGPKEPDGSTVEVHHNQQKPDGELIPMTKDEHRGPGNHKRNHPDRGPSRINPKQRKKDTRDYWKNLVKKLEEGK